MTFQGQPYTVIGVWSNGLIWFRWTFSSSPERAKIRAILDFMDLLRYQPGFPPDPTPPRSFSWSDITKQLQNIRIVTVLLGYIENFRIPELPDYAKWLSQPFSGPTAWDLVKDLTPRGKKEWRPA